MANNSEILGEEAAVRQIVENDFSATNGVFEDDSVTKLRQYAFQSKTTLKKAKLPNLTGELERTFVNDRALALADIGYCSKITSFAFNSCNSLIAVILRKSSVVYLANNTNAFGGTKYATNGAGGAYVYVPRNLISSYQTATNWSTLYAAHSDMFRALEDYTVDGTTTGDFDETKL